MRALFDVNMLIALLDEGHLHHGLAVDWLVEHEHLGWASCPLTQNGCLRILSLPAYPNSQPVRQVADRLSEAVLDGSHEFWPDDLSLVGHQGVNWDHVLGSRQLTDIYLLAWLCGTKPAWSLWIRAFPFMPCRPPGPRIL